VQPPNRGASAYNAAAAAAAAAAVKAALARNVAWMFVLGEKASFSL